MSASHHRSLDGLRGLCITAVFLFHTRTGTLPGGFVGVEVFFALSGFLITGVLCSAVERERWWGARFTARRAARLLPGLLFGVLVAGLLWPAAMAQVPFSSVLAPIFFYYANWVVLIRGFLALDPLGPTWSLAVEGQFYLVWPFAVWALWRREGARRLALPLCLGLAVTLALVRNGLFSVIPWWFLYPSTFAHVDVLLLGGALAFAQRRLDLAPAARSIPATLLALVCLTGLAWMARFSPPMFHPFHARHGFAIAGALSVLLIAHCTAAPGAPLPRALASAPLVALGQRSYGLYLIHYPIIQWTERLRLPAGGPLAEWQVMALRVLISLSLAWLSFDLVEEPVRRWVKRRLQSVPAVPVPARRAE